MIYERTASKYTASQDEIISGVNYYIIYCLTLLQQVQT